MTSIIEIIENTNIDIDQTEYYAAIIGESPSKGARSPVLWNAAFKAMNLSGMMHPMDVIPEKLEKAVENLRADNRFIGGAVTMPYKIQILPYLDAVEPAAKIIGAVNCIYRDGARLVGSNTDGAGALWSLKRIMREPLEEKTILLFGTGGAGTAVAAYLAEALGKNGTLKLANRSSHSRDRLAEKLKNMCKVENIKHWPVSEKNVGDLDVLVNCTSIGFETVKKDQDKVYSLQGYSPLGMINSDIRVAETEHALKAYHTQATPHMVKNYEQTLRLLSGMQQPVVFDIIYQPEQTVLLNAAKLFGFQILNGLPMNLEQAVLAFERAIAGASLGSPDCALIRNSMSMV